MNGEEPGSDKKERRKWMTLKMQAMQKGCEAEEIDEVTEPEDGVIVI